MQHEHEGGIGCVRNANGAAGTRGEPRPPQRCSVEAERLRRREMDDNLERGRTYILVNRIGIVVETLGEAQRRVRQPCRV